MTNEGSLGWEIALISVNGFFIGMVTGIYIYIYIVITVNDLMIVM